MPLFFTSEVCYRFPWLSSSKISVYTTGPTGNSVGPDYLMCPNVVSVGENATHEHLFIFCFVRATSRNRTGTAEVTNSACCHYTIVASVRICTGATSGGNEKWATHSRYPFLYSGKRRFLCLSSSSVSVRGECKWEWCCCTTPIYSNGVSGFPVWTRQR
ncbi:MAG: hypothetical protein RIR69_407 [Actinomycetota bacterium]